MKPRDNALSKPDVNYKKRLGYAAKPALAKIMRNRRIKNASALIIRQRTIALRSHRCAHVCATVRIPHQSCDPTTVSIR
jgi:hypothetical protein